MTPDPFDAPDNFMARDQREFRFFQVPVNDVKIGPADTTGLNPDLHLARPGQGIIHFT